MPRPPLFVSYDDERDLLVALEHGRTEDGQPDAAWRPVAGDGAVVVARHLDLGGRRPRHAGFVAAGFSVLDPFSPALAPVWRGPRCDAGQLALTNASVGEVLTAARAALEPGRSTFDRLVLRDAYDRLWEEDPGEGLALGRLALQAGNAEAHLVIGRAHLGLGEEREAYAHLRHYARIAPHDAWNQRWLGVAAEAVGNEREAGAAYRRAIVLARPGDATLDARELLAALQARRSGAGRS